MNPLDEFVSTEIAAINSSPSNTIGYRYRCIIKTPIKDIYAFNVQYVSTLRDFTGRFSDVNEIQVMVTLEEGVFDIIPFKSQLTVTLQRIPLQVSQDVIDDPNQVHETFEYRGQLWDESSAVLESRSSLIKDRETARSAGMIAISLQLITDTVEKIMSKSVGGTFRDAVPTELIQYLLGSYSNDAGDSATNAVVGVNIQQGADQKRYTHINIPHNTRLIDAPKKVAESTGGIYPTGFFYYLQGSMWYVFSPYDTRLFDKVQRKLTIINLTKDKYRYTEKTYRNNLGQVTLLSTGETKHVDLSDREQLSKGNISRFIDADVLVEGFAETGDNKMIVNRSKNTRQYMINEREQGYNRVAGGVKITSNYLSELSELARRSGSMAQFTWENGNIDLIYPGMPVRVIYASSAIPTEIFGTVVSLEAYDENINRNPVDRQFRTNIALTVFLSNFVPPSPDLNEPLPEQG